MRQIAIYFTDPGFDDYPFDDERYRQAYDELATCIEEKGSVCTIVRGPETYAGGMRFRGGWMYEKGTYHRFEEEKKYDVVFNKGKLAFTDSAHVINEPAFDELCTDKWKSYRTFPDFFPKTVRVERAEEMDAAMDTVGTRIVVAKPLDGAGGEGVRVGQKEEIRSHVRTFPYLIQACLDTSGGVPGLAPGRHDLRIISMAGRPVVAILRQPQEGKFLANLSQGGQHAELPLTDIPTGALALFRNIDQQLQQYRNRLYSLDIGRDSDGTWRIFELNAQPGLMVHELGQEGRRFNALLCDFLIGA